MSDANEDILDNDLEPLTPDKDDYDVDAEEAELDQEETNAAIQQKLADIEAEMETLRQLIKLEPQLKNPFIAALGTGGQFQELCLLNNSASTFAGGRSGSVSTLSSGQVLMLEMRDTDAMRFVNPFLGNPTGTNVTVVTSLAVSGTSGTVNTQAYTVLAAGTTSAYNVTFPSGGTSSRPYQGLLYSWHENGTVSDSLSLAYGDSGSFSIIAPIPAVDNGTGSTYDPVLRTGNVFEFTASGEYQFASSHTGNGLSLIVIIDDGVAVTYPSFFIGGAGLNQDMMSQPFAWALRASVTICDDLKVRIAGQLILAPLLNLPFTNPYFAPIVASSVGRTPDFLVPSSGGCRFRLGAAADSNGSDVVVYLNSMTLALFGPSP